MASRAQQKAQLREERLAREQAAAAAKAQRQRLLMIGGIVVAAVVVAAVAVIISTSGGGKSTSASAATNSESSTAKAAVARVSTLLAGIPEQTDNVLGSASAPVTITEYGDLECSVCDSFALPTNIYTSAGEAGSGIEDQIITDLVKTGKAKFVYDSLDTATSDGVTPNMFYTQQEAAYAAGLQKLGWYYIELFYNEQGREGTDYVTTSYLDGIAKQVPGLNYALWKKDLSLSTLKSQVASEITSGTKVDEQASGDGASTPTVMVSGKKGEEVVSEGIPTYAEVTTAIKAVS